MVGMNVIDAWKLNKIGKITPQTIKEYADILSRDLINATMRKDISTYSLATSIEINYNTICISRHILTSSLSQEVDPGSIHTHT